MTMKKLAGLVLFAVAHAASAASFQWGVEAWTLGSHDFAIQLPPGSKLISITGAVTASPQGSFNPASNVNRQSLLTLINPDHWTQSTVTAAWQTGIGIQNISPHLLSVNVKVTGATAQVIPVNFRPSTPVTLVSGSLLLDIVNASYYSTPGGQGISATDFLDGIDVEWQVTVEYQ